jgi:hypothetical protein
MREYFYYLRDKDGHPRITVCLMQTDDVETWNTEKGYVYSRGLAICSYSEKIINKKQGRRLAHKRAFHAMMVQEDTMPIRYEGLDAMGGIDIPNRLGIRFYGGPDSDFKSQFNVELTDFEKRLLG